MGGFTVSAFSGIAPRYADRLLEASQASFVTNLRPTNGDLRGFRSLGFMLRTTAVTPLRKALRLHYPGLSTFEWYFSNDVGADALPSPLANDTSNRIYITDKQYSTPVVTTLTGIHDNVAPQPLGVPVPNTPPGVSASGGTGSANEVRAYVYTWVGLYGAEGAPSPPTVLTARLNDTWTITVPGIVSPLGKTNVYRSGTGDTAANFYKIGEIPAGSTTVVDSIAADQLALQPMLDSYDNDPPPAGLYGLQQHSSGAFVGFKGRTVYFSKPYLPHAWPTDYAYTVEGEVVGLGCIYNQVMVMTTTFPAVLAGSSPDAIQILNLADPEPCLCKRSIVVMNNTVYYASPNGIIAISANGLSRPTNPLLTRLEFETYATTDIVAGSYGSYYVAFYNANQGFVVALPPYEPVSFVLLDRFSDVTGLDTDKTTGDLYVMQTDRVSQFDAQHDSRFACTWRSKEFIAPKAVNLGAFQVLARLMQEDVDSQQALITAAQDYNAERLAEGPLDLINGYAINSAIDIDFSNVDPILGGLPPIQPIGGEPLYDFDSGGSLGMQGLRFTLYANDNVVYTQIIEPEKTHRLPSGYKATRYYLEVASSIPVQQISIASNPRELGKV